MSTLKYRCAIYDFQVCRTRHCHDNLIFARTLWVELLPQFLCTSSETWYTWWPWGVDMQDMFFEFVRHLSIAMVTTFYCKILVGGTTSTVLMHFKWKLVNEMTLKCRCTICVTLVCQTRHCHGNHIFAKTLLVKLLPVFMQFKWNLMHMMTLKCKCARRFQLCRTKRWKKAYYGLHFGLFDT